MYAAGVRGCTITQCGDERRSDQHRFVPDVTDQNWISHFTVSPLHCCRQAMIGDGIKSREEAREDSMRMNSEVKITNNKSKITKIKGNKTNRKNEER